MANICRTQRDADTRARRTGDEMVRDVRYGAMDTAASPAAYEAVAA